MLDQNLDSLNFSEEDLQPIEIPVSLGKRKFILREADGDISFKYNNACLKRLTLGPEGKPQKVDGLADVEPLLVMWCLRERELDSEGQPVEGKFIVGSPSLADVRSWPPKVINAYSEKIKEISELDTNEDTMDSLLKAKESIEEKIRKLEAGDDPTKND